MKNLTLSIDPEIVKKVRKIALERDTSLTAMVRDYLEQLAKTEDAEREMAVADLKASFVRCSRPVGPRDWTRDDLHER